MIGKSCSVPSHCACVLSLARAFNRKGGFNLPILKLLALEFLALMDFIMGMISDESF